MERRLQNTTSTITATFYVDGVPTDPAPATATIGITRADGTVLVTPGTATSRQSTGVFSYQLSAAQTALLDTLTATWTTSNLGAVQTTVEIAGGFLFSIADLRTLAPLNNTTTYPTSAITDMRTAVEQAIEDACGVAFVPRYTLETIQGSPTQTDLGVSWGRVRTVRSAVIDGVTVNPLTNVQIRPDGRLYLYLGWTAYTVFPYVNAVTVGYEHGYSVPPERVKRAAMLLARNWLVSGPIDERASTFTSTDGGTYSLVTAGRGGSLFGFPEVDVVVQQYGQLGSVF